VRMYAHASWWPISVVLSLGSVISTSCLSLSTTTYNSSENNTANGGYPAIYANYTERGSANSEGTAGSHF